MPHALPGWDAQIERIGEALAETWAGFTVVVVHGISVTPLMRR